MSEPKDQNEAACGGSALTAELGLLPCPFCGKAETLDVITGQEFMDDEQEFWPHSDSYAVVCDAATNGKGGCGAMGGFAATTQAAITKWNMRPND